MIIGVDFDNTIVDYGELLHKLALERNYIDQSLQKDKKTIRDSIRTLFDGELKWRELQAEMYGKRMAEAIPFTGVLDFFHKCKQKGIETLIISHKTKFSNLTGNGADFHKNALDWLHNNDFLETNKTGLNRDRIFFNPDRDGKIKCIIKSGCNVFIDDLKEVFEDSSFPEETRKILFSPSHKELNDAQKVMVCHSWDDITRTIGIL